jgi:hypothetical protein
MYEGTFFMSIPLIPYSYGVEVLFVIPWIYTQSVGLLGRVIGPSQGLYLYTEQHKQNKLTHTKHPCPKWASNPPS